MDMRYDMRDGRRLPPRNARGEFRRRRSRRDRGMDYEREDMRMRDYGDVTRRGRFGDYGDYQGDMARGGSRGGGRGRGGDRGDMGDYGYSDMRGGDMRRSDYGDMARGDRGDMARGGDRGMDGHYGMHGGMGGYQPIEAMGYFNGYYGMPEQDFARGGRGGRGGDRGYDMAGRDYGDYGEDDYGDYGETLSEEELEKWGKKLKSELDEREKQMFSKDAIMQKARQMGKPMEGFAEKELEVATLMVYTDYKNTIGQNPDLAIKLAFDWLSDKDAAVKGAEKLAVYYDCIVEGE